MFNVHGFLNNRKVIDWHLPHIPNVGDTVRLNQDTYATVTEVIWCLDEPIDQDMKAQRVNIRMEKL